jgi:hypothetical protein
MFHQKFASNVIQHRYVICNNKPFFLFFSTNTTFYFILLPGVCRGDPSLSPYGTRILIFSVVKKEKREREMVVFAD